MNKQPSTARLRHLFHDLMCHKYLYYRGHSCAVNDYQYDFLEKMYELHSGKEMPCGFPPDPRNALSETRAFQPGGMEKVIPIWRLGPTATRNYLLSEQSVTYQILEKYNYERIRDFFRKIL